MRLGLVPACVGMLFHFWGHSLVGVERDSLRIEPRRIEIGLFHGGVRLTVTEEVPAGSDVAVVVIGPMRALQLRRQVRVWHAFWTPGASVTFDGIPTLYVLHTTTALEDLAPDTVRRAHGIGYESFRTTADGDTDALFPELVRLKEWEGLFQTEVGAVRVVPGAGGRDTVVASIALPARTPPATYDVRLFGFQRGQLTVRREADVEVVRGAVTALVDDLAHAHRIAYGMLAVGVAVGAGLLVGLVFGTTKGH